MTHVSSKDACCRPNGTTRSATGGSSSNDPRPPHPHLGIAAGQIEHDKEA